MTTQLGELTKAAMAEDSSADLQLNGTLMLAKAALRSALQAIPVARRTERDNLLLHMLCTFTVTPRESNSRAKYAVEHCAQTGNKVVRYHRTKVAAADDMRPAKPRTTQAGVSKMIDLKTGVIVAIRDWSRVYIRWLPVSRSKITQ